MASSHSQVVEQDRNGFRGKGKPNRQKSHQCPVKPRHSGGLLIQALKHLRPQVASQLSVRHWRNSLSEELANFFGVRLAHASTPTPFSFLRTNPLPPQTPHLTPPA